MQPNFEKVLVAVQLGKIQDAVDAFNELSGEDKQALIHDNRDHVSALVLDLFEAFVLSEEGGLKDGGTEGSADDRLTVNQGNEKPPEATPDGISPEVVDIGHPSAREVAEAKGMEVDDEAGKDDCRPKSEAPKGTDLGGKAKDPGAPEITSEDEADSVFNGIFNGKDSEAKNPEDVDLEHDVPEEQKTTDGFRNVGDDGVNDIGDDNEENQTNEKE